MTCHIHSEHLLENRSDLHWNLSIFWAEFVKEHQNYRKLNLSSDHNLSEYAWIIAIIISRAAKEAFEW